MTTRIAPIGVAAIIGFVVGYSSRAPDTRITATSPPEIRRAIPVEPKIRKAIPVQTGQPSLNSQSTTLAFTNPGIATSSSKR